MKDDSKFLCYAKNKLFILKWGEGLLDKIKEQLLQMSEEEYRKFSSALIPNGEKMLGVRLPNLRKLAKSIAKADWRSYLMSAEDTYFEEIMLQGMVIGYVETNIEERFHLIENFIPKIHNWSICDSFCIGLKCAKQYPKEVWDFIHPYFSSRKEFEIRFAIVMALDFFVDEQHIDEIFLLLSKAKLEKYYAQMAAAWALSVCFVRFPDETMFFLRKGILDEFTYQKALSKIIESRQVTPAIRQLIRQMRRKE